MTNTIARAAAASFAALALTAPVYANPLPTGSLCNHDYMKTGVVTSSPDGDTATNGQIRSMANCERYLDHHRQSQDNQLEAERLRQREMSRVSERMPLLQRIPLGIQLGARFFGMLRGSQPQPTPYSQGLQLSQY